ncbi:hypothetical protein ACFLSS_03130 [Bacteroidota bacterium]
MDEEQQLKNLLHRTNKEITKLKYEGDFFNDSKIKEMIETLQHHIFLIHTFFDKPEFTVSDVETKMAEKLKGS